MAKRNIFYSFHFDNDVMRVQLIRNIGSIEENKPVTVNRWEEIKRGGESTIKKWIDETLKGKSCLVVLVGEKTSERKWVKYEIIKAWNEGKGVVGVYIHNLKCARNGYCTKGSNPFDNIVLQNGKKLSTVVKCYNPDPSNAYKSISENLESWIEEAIKNR